MKIVMMALFWGLVSAVSLPLGAVIGLWSKPSRKIISIIFFVKAIAAVRA